MSSTGVTENKELERTTK